ncbi:MAG: hypothetical protein ACR2NZ_03630 [Rubripirellula sp.]
MPQLDSFAAADFAEFPAVLTAAIEAAPMAGLGDGPEDPKLAEILRTDPLQEVSSLTDLQRRLCTSGLWLLAGDLDRSHTLSQDISSAEGSFWHGIMHRREGDFGNSKYWFRRVGEHPAFDVIAERAEGDYDDPDSFVDACSRAKGESSERCQLAQWIEWQTLMVHCLTNC